MSDIYIRIIPTDPSWQPSPEAAAAAVAYVKRLFAGPQDAVERVDPIFYDEVTLIDAGEYLTRITCPHCRQGIDIHAFCAALGPRLPTVDSLTIQAPCCGALVGLDSLRYDSPVGLARFEVSAMNWTRDRWDLDDDELASVAAILGHPVTQIHTHY